MILRETKVFSMKVKMIFSALAEVRMTIEKMVVPESKVRVRVR